MTRSAALGAKLTKDNITGYAIPLGVTGGIGGAQAFVEFVLSSMLAGNTGALFAPDGRNIGFSDERLLLAATTIRDLFAQEKRRRRSRCNSATTNCRMDCVPAP